MGTLIHITMNIWLLFKLSFNNGLIHYNDIVMGAIASQFTSLPIVYLTLDSGADQRKYQSSASLALYGEFTVTGEFRAQRASNAENVSIWWRHHVSTMFGHN